MVGDGDELERLVEAHRVARRVADEAESQLHRYLREARGAGRTWEEIGAALGVSKRAAQQRYVRRRLRGIRAVARRAAKFNVPFDEDASQVLGAADREARRRGHEYVGSEHLFLALLEHPASAALLERAELPRRRVRERLEGILVTAGEASPGNGVRVPTPRLDRVLTFAAGNAFTYGAPSVAVEHLLGAVLVDTSGIVEAALVEAGRTSSMMLSARLPELGVLEPSQRQTA